MCVRVCVHVEGLVEMRAINSVQEERHEQRGDNAGWLGSWWHLVGVTVATSLCASWETASESWSWIFQDFHPLLGFAL